ncbi:MAG TPA: YlmC/YmxH family sporulation protein [Candidatus Merdivicinus intestinigallinarum]|nr:YlmC/YmxH family sporulation protein [Candidatus Merdivicinus intestinigallinarum]
METSMEALRRKEIVNLKDGSKLGYADDAVLDVETARVLRLVVKGRARCFGLLGRQSDLLIPWEDIQVIGEDTILINMTDCPKESIPKRFKWLDFWNNL